MGFEDEAEIQQAKEPGVTQKVYDRTYQQIGNTGSQWMQYNKESGGVGRQGCCIS